MAWLAEAFVDVVITQAPGVTRLALAAEGGQAVLTGAVVAGVGCTLVNIKLAVLSSVT